MRQYNLDLPGKLICPFMKKKVIQKAKKKKPKGQFTTWFCLQKRKYVTFSFLFSLSHKNTFSQVCSNNGFQNSKCFYGLWWFFGLVANWCSTLVTPWTVACQLPLSMGFSRKEFIAIFFSRGSSQPRNRTQESCIAGRFFTYWATREAYVYMISIKPCS